MDPWSMDPLRGPSPWTPFMDRVKKDSWPDLTSDPRSFAAGTRVYAMLRRKDKALAWNMHAEG